MQRRPDLIWGLFPPLLSRVVLDDCHLAEERSGVCFIQKTKSSKSLFLLESRSFIKSVSPPIFSHVTPGQDLFPCCVLEVSLWEAFWETSIYSGKLFLKIVSGTDLAQSPPSSAPCLEKGVNWLILLSPFPDSLAFCKK